MTRGGDDWLAAPKQLAGPFVKELRLTSWTALNVLYFNAIQNARYGRQQVYLSMIAKDPEKWQKFIDSLPAATSLVAVELQFSEFLTQQIEKDYGSLSFISMDCKTPLQDKHKDKYGTKLTPEKVAKLKSDFQDLHKNLVFYSNIYAKDSDVLTIINLVASYALNAPQLNFNELTSEIFNLMNKGQTKLKSKFRGFINNYLLEGLYQKPKVKVRSKSTRTKPQKTPKRKRGTTNRFDRRR